MNMASKYKSRGCPRPSDDVARSSAVAEIPRDAVVKSGGLIKVIGNSADE